MAEKFKYGVDAEDVTRQDELSTYPEQIICEYDDNGREAPFTTEELMDMVDSIIEHGQLQPVICRKVQGKKPKLVLGYRRYLAVAYINSKPALLSEHFGGNKLKIRFKLRDVNDEEAFVLNLAENMDRLELTPLDHARNQRRLREKYGWSEDRIAKHYKVSLSYVSQLKRSLQIPKALTDLIRDGKLSFADGLDLTALPDKEAIKVVKENQDPATGKVDNTAVKTKVRTAKIDKGESKARTPRELKNFFKKMLEINDVGPTKALADAFLNFMDGTVTDEQFENNIWKILEKK